MAADLAILDIEPGSFDVISICSPTPYHGEHLKAAIDLRPKVIFAEKPLASSAREASQIAEACAGNAIELCVNYTRRWAPDIVDLAQRLREGEWGRIHHAVGRYSRGIVHNGSHMVDLCEMLFGPLRVLGTGSPVIDAARDDPTVPALLETKDGAAIHLCAGDARDYAIFELDIVTARGQISMLDGGFTLATREVVVNEAFAGYHKLGIQRTRPGCYGEAMSAAVDNIAAALDRGVPLASTGTNAVVAQRLCEAIRDVALARLS